MGIPPEPDILWRALDELGQIVEKAQVPDTSTRRQRLLTKAATIDDLRRQNEILRQGLAHCEAGIKRWSMIIAELYHKVPGAKERIDKYLDGHK